MEKNKAEIVSIDESELNEEELNSVVTFLESKLGAGKYSSIEIIAVKDTIDEQTVEERIEKSELHKDEDYDRLDEEKDAIVIDSEKHIMV